MRILNKYNILIVALVLISTGLATLLVFQISTTKYSNTDNIALDTPSNEISTDNIYGVSTLIDNNIETTEITEIFEAEELVLVEIQEVTNTPIITKTTTPKPTNSTPPLTTVTPTTVVPTTAVPVITYPAIPRQVVAGCPATTNNCTPCTSGTYCRFEQGYTEYGFLGWSCQNNNPGNIRPSDFRTNIIVNNGGVAPCGSRTDAYGRGSYMVFSNYTNGFNALKAYLTGIAAGQHSSYAGIVDGVYQVCGNCNLKLFSSKYVGTTIEAQDDINSYANKIANRIGVDANTTMMNWIVSNKLTDFANAIRINEGWYGN